MHNDFINKMIYHTVCHKERHAVVINGHAHSYENLFTSAYALSQVLEKYERRNVPCVILSEKTLFFFKAVIACFFSDLIYTPINLHAAIERNKNILQSISPAIVLIGDGDINIIAELLKFIKPKYILVVNLSQYKKLISKLKRKNIFYLKKDMDENKNLQHIHYKKNKKAYLLFTSGSTGIPKGVVISNQNLNAYLNAILTLFPITHDENVVQFADIGFDISIHEMFACWTSGATLFVYNESTNFSLGKFIDENKITHCILVPSTLSILFQQHHIIKCNFASIRTMLVCGEPFPLLFAKKLNSINANCVMANLYGPTEATVACTYHIYSENNAYGELLNVPIGFPLVGSEVNLSSNNEILIKGNQVFNGYWKNEKKSNSKDNTYFTGDCASFHPDFGLLFCGRQDNQWQIRGCRTERSEIEAALQLVTHNDHCFVAPHFDHQHLIDYLIVVSNKIIDLSLHYEELKSLLAVDIIPKRFHLLTEIPKLSNGKIDYKKIQALTEVIS